MKKSDLIKVIREIVRQELRKELPNALAQVFAQMLGQAQRPEIHHMNMVRYLQPAKSVQGTEVAHKPSPAEVPTEKPEEVDEMVSLKAQLSELFHGETPVPKTAPPATQPKQFTKNPILNEILNQTSGFTASDRMAMRAGGISPGVAMAASSYGGMALPETGAGQMMDASDLNFLRGVPTMPGASNGPMLTELPAQAQPQAETSVPASGLGQVSALDIKNHPALPDSIKGILNRDYRSLVKNFNRDRNK